MSVQDFEATLASGGYGGLRRLSPAAELLLASVNIYDYFVWHNNNGAELTSEQRETIELRNAASQYEIITEETDMPIGTVIPLATTTVPEYALICDGSSHQRVDYPNLYDILAARFIVDSDTFTVPQLTDRFVRGNTGVTASIGATGGSNQIVLSESNLPSHNHTYQIRPQVPYGVTPGPSPVLVSGTVSIVTTGRAGDGVPVVNRPANILLRYIIVAR